MTNLRRWGRVDAGPFVFGPGGAKPIKIKVSIVGADGRYTGDELHPNGSGGLKRTYNAGRAGKIAPSANEVQEAAKLLTMEAPGGDPATDASHRR